MLNCERLEDRDNPAIHFRFGAPGIGGDPSGIELLVVSDNPPPVPETVIHLSHPITFRGVQVSEIVIDV